MSLMAESSPTVTDRGILIQSAIAEMLRRSSIAGPARTGDQERTIDVSVAAAPVTATALTVAEQDEAKRRKALNDLLNHMNERFSKIRIEKTNQEPSVVEAPQLIRLASAPDASSQLVIRHRSLSASETIPIAGRFKCAICFDECLVKAKSCCAGCVSPVLCLSCHREMWKAEIDRRRFYVRTLECIHCHQPLNAQAWRECVGEQLYGVFMQNLKNIFVVRCPGCDYDTSMLGSWNYLDSVTPEEAYAKVVAELDISMHESFDRLVADFKNLQPDSAQALIDFIFSNCEEIEARGLLTPQELQMRVDSEVDYGDLSGELYGIFEDPERKAILLHTFLRDVPRAKAVTPCCQCHICFNCKTHEWHEDETCAERIQRTANEVNSDQVNPTEVYSCPECFLQFTHAGGCSSIRCLCGNEFYLSEDY